MKEDEREEKELRAYMASALAAEMTNLLPPNQQQTTRSDDQKTPVSRQEAAAEWLRTRQGGTGQPNPDRPGEGR